METPEFVTAMARIAEVETALTATNLVLCCALAVLTKEQRSQVTELMAAESAIQQRAFETSALPEIRSLVQPFQDAEDRLYRRFVQTVRRSQGST